MLKVKPLKNRWLFHAVVCILEGCWSLPPLDPAPPLDLTRPLVSLVDARVRSVPGGAADAEQ